jgi:hypothetical protein
LTLLARLPTTAPPAKTMVSQIKKEKRRKHKKAARTDKVSSSDKHPSIKSLNS